MPAQRFSADGFLVLDQLLSPTQLAALRADCAAVLDAAAPQDVSRDRGCVFETASDCVRAASSSFWASRPAAAAVLRSSPLLLLVTTLLGDCPALCLLNEQYVVKPAHSGPAAAFAWHRDGDWCSDTARPRYLSLWCPLDDCSEDNGTLLVAPGSHRSGAPTLEPFVCTVAAGSCVVLSDAVLHCSGPNLADSPRRVWMPQLAAAPVLRSDGSPVALAVPLS